LENHELIYLDYEILRFLETNEKVSKGEIIAHLQEDSDLIEHRLNLLSQHKRKKIGDYRSPSFPLANSNYIQQEFESYEDNAGISHINYLDAYSIAIKGKQALKDHLFNTSKEDARYKETLNIAKESNNIAKFAILISVVALIVSFFKG